MLQSCSCTDGLIDFKRSKHACNLLLTRLPGLTAPWPARQIAQLGCCLDDFHHRHYGVIRRHLTCPRYRHAGYPHRTCALPKFVCYLLVNLLITAFELLPRPLLRAQKSDPKVCADAELSQAVHRGERRVDAD